MKNLHLITTILFVLLITSCQQKSEWSQVFNGENLNNWDSHIGTPIKGFEDRATSATPAKVFSVAELNGEKVIRISGDVNASLATRENYENYHFQMEFRWSDGVYGARNGGLLYHSYGPFGVGLGTWMSSHELQFMTGNVGDSYRMGDTYCEIPVNEKGDQFYFRPGAGMKPFGELGVKKIARKIKDMERPIGEWNVIDLYCYDDMSVHVVNGETVMVNYKSGKYENGEVKPLTSGKIQFQSEGGEMFMRNLRIRNINKIPSEVLL
jgi:hypothetical protein